MRIAGSLGKRTIAEFVGDQGTADALRTIGVNLGQGYHFGQPAPIEEVLGRASLAKTLATQPQEGGAPPPDFSP